MLVSLDLVSLILYCIQQLGVMLGVGAQTILLITYAISVRDGVVDAKESQIARAVTKALVAGLALMVISGIAIVGLHFWAGQREVLMAPAFLFKWLLIAFLIIATFAWRNKPFPDFVWEGILGASWYALFAIHIMAPVAAWFDLIVLYVVWVAGFLLMWSASVFMTHKKEGGKNPAKIPEKKSSDAASAKAAVPAFQKLLPQAPPVPKPEQKPPAPPAVKILPVSKAVSPPPAAPKPAASAELPKPVLPLIIPEPAKRVLPSNNITTVLPPNPNVSPVPDAPKPEPQKINLNEHPGLPAIRVMPRTKEELEKHI